MKSSVHTNAEDLKSQKFTVIMNFINWWIINQDPPIHMNYAAAKARVPRAERNNCTIKEHVQATYHGLPYTHLLCILVKYLVTKAARKLNFFLNKHSVSKYFSPWMILHQENIDYNHHCKHSLWDYVQAHDDIDHKNTTAACSLDCLYLHPTSSKQEGHELLHLQTNHVITRHNVTSIPVTPSIISQVHELACLDGMPPGLKITSHTNQILFNSAWTAGVDYDEEDFQDEILNQKMRNTMKNMKRMSMMKSTRISRPK